MNPKNSLDGSIARLLPDECFRKWDGWDYKISSPLSLDDPVDMVVLLRNKDGTGQVITLDLSEATVLKVEDAKTRVG